jgi:16S rRNA (uracil1498-N3)-methyltransferase
MRKNATVRLYFEAPLSEGGSVSVEGTHLHYLCNVMRLRPGDSLYLFNGKDGEWRAEIEAADRRSARLLLRERYAEPEPLAPLVLYVSPLKREPTAFLVQKATELGVGRIVPCVTERSVASEFNRERLRRIAVEAAEQCERRSVPDIDEAVRLSDMLTALPEDVALFHADESGGGRPLGDVLKARPRAKEAGFLIGPEGGFAREERERVASHPAAVPVCLGPRILKAETAALALLACYQCHHGDWDALPRFGAARA